MPRRHTHPEHEPRSFSELKKELAKKREKAGTKDRRR